MSRQSIPAATAETKLDFLDPGAFAGCVTVLASFSQARAGYLRASREPSVDQRQRDPAAVPAALSESAPAMAPPAHQRPTSARLSRGLQCPRGRLSSSLAPRAVSSVG